MFIIKVLNKRLKLKNSKHCGIILSLMWSLLEKIRLNNILTKVKEPNRHKVRNTEILIDHLIKIRNKLTCKISMTLLELRRITAHLDLQDLRITVMEQ